MEQGGMLNGEEEDTSSTGPLPFARSYQIEAYDKAREQNTIVFLETGSGKTLIAIMLMRSFANVIRKPSKGIAVFLVPQVVLVHQQGEVIKLHTDLKVGMYWGDMNVDLWDAARWIHEYAMHEVLVMTPAILLSTLRHGFLNFQSIKLMIVDECHHAKGKHPYACIMTEFYHRSRIHGNCELPRILGMTASPINSKVLESREDYLKNISDLENMMHSKVFTVVNDSVLSEYLAMPKAKLVLYDSAGIPSHLLQTLKMNMDERAQEHMDSFKKLDLEEEALESLKRKVSKLHAYFIFCLDELGLWPAFLAAESIFEHEPDVFCWKNLSARSRTTAKKFSKDVRDMLCAYIPKDVSRTIDGDHKAGSVTGKILSLVNSLMEYRDLTNMRCIIFVERIITAVVLRQLVNAYFGPCNGWKAEYIAGISSLLPSQTRKRHNKIIEEFRRGEVNIVISTSILEEGLDVQSCHLVVRFDLSTNVCSFIQSKGRARMQDSVFLLMLPRSLNLDLSSIVFACLLCRDDISARLRVEKFLQCGRIMKEVSAGNSSVPCLPCMDILDEPSYRVDSTGAVVTLTSSVSLLYLYCSRLPHDGYFRPEPRFCIDKVLKTCKLYLPNSSPLKPVEVEGDSVRMLRKIACLEACKRLHSLGALTDNLIPDIEEEKAAASEIENMPYDENKPAYFPTELVSLVSTTPKIVIYHCYSTGLKKSFQYNVLTPAVMLLLREKLEDEILGMRFHVDTGRGSVTAGFSYTGPVEMSSAHVDLCREFQVRVLRILLRRDGENTRLAVGGNAVIDYLLLPSKGGTAIDWESVRSVRYPTVARTTRSNATCKASIQRAVVCTPHNGFFYVTDGFDERLNIRSRMDTGQTYQRHYESRGVVLLSTDEPLVKARRVFAAHNFVSAEGTVSNAYTRSGRADSEEYTAVHLPREACEIVMSPISMGTVYSFSFMPSVMHGVESALLALDLKRIHGESFPKNLSIPTRKVLEAITMKKCQEGFHLETLETFGDSFLKYMASKWLFLTYRSHHEGLLTIKKNLIISNSSLCRLGCSRNLPGFIRTDPFDPTGWLVPGEAASGLTETVSPSTVMRVKGTRKVTKKKVADVVESLIGAYLSFGGETSALSFMLWVGIQVDFAGIERPFPAPSSCSAAVADIINLSFLQSTLGYTFRDPALLVEALTHGSYTVLDSSNSYQRLEFLGDAVLDYAVTEHMYRKYPRMTPGMLTDMRSASVNNDCYAHAAVKAGLHKHILHFSRVLFSQMTESARRFREESGEAMFGWNSEIPFPKVLGDVVESLAGAIYVDSGYRKEVVFECVRPLLEPLVTPATLGVHPVRELVEHCQKLHVPMKKVASVREDGCVSVTVEVVLGGVVHSHTHACSDKKLALKLACREVLSSLKRAMSS